MKIYLTVIIASIYNITAHTQNEFKKESYWGLKSGINIHQVAFDANINTKIDIGYTSGFVFKYIEEKGHGIQLELNLQQVGWSEKISQPYSYTRHSSYIQVPIMTQFIFDEGNKSYLLHLGIYGSALIKEKEKINLPIDYNPLKNSRDLPSWFTNGKDIVNKNVYYGQSVDKKTEYGICAGLGISWHPRNAILQLEIRYNQSLCNVFDPKKYAIYSSKSQFMEITLVYLIGK